MPHCSVIVCRPSAMQAQVLLEGSAQTMPIRMLRQCADFLCIELASEESQGA